VREGLPTAGAETPERQSDVSAPATHEKARAVAYGVICTLYAAGSLVAGGALTLIAFENHKFAAVVAGIVAGLTFVLFMISGHLAALNVKYFVLHPPKNKRPMAALSWGITNLVSGISSALRTTEGEISEENERSKKAALTLLLLGVALASRWNSFGGLRNKGTTRCRRARSLSAPARSAMPVSRSIWAIQNPLCSLP
jgi:hypothetical protein